MDFLKSLSIAASGLRAQAGRMRVIAENIANADSTAKTAGADPYRRKIPTFQSEIDRSLDARIVTMGRLRTDPTDFQSKYQPGHPAADSGAESGSRRPAYRQGCARQRREERRRAATRRARSRLG